MEWAKYKSKRICSWAGELMPAFYYLNETINETIERIKIDLPYFTNNADLVAT